MEFEMKMRDNAVFLSLLLISSAAALAQPSALNDAQIVRILVAASTVDIDTGKLAEQQSENAEVNLFANELVTDHTVLNGQVTALMRKLKLTPKDSDSSKSLKEAAEAAIAAFVNVPVASPQAACCNSPA
jgi:putative membrane protein